MLSCTSFFNFVHVYQTQILMCMPCYAMPCHDAMMQSYCRCALNWGDTDFDAPSLSSKSHPKLRMQIQIKGKKKTKKREEAQCQWGPPFEAELEVHNFTFTTGIALIFSLFFFLLSLISWSYKREADSLETPCT